jgi:mRNA interferase MazF
MDDIRRGEVWWVDLVIQDDYFNRSALATVIVVAVTKNLALAELPGNVLVAPRETGLKYDCVANLTAVVTVDRRFFADPGHPLGALSRRTMELIDKGLSLVLSL